MDGSEAAAEPVTIVDDMIAAMPLIQVADINNGDLLEDTADDTEDEAIQTVEPVEESYFDTASVGTDPQAELELYG